MKMLTEQIFLRSIPEYTVFRSGLSGRGRLFVCPGESVDLIAHLLDDGLRTCDSDTPSYGHDPSQKLVADCDIDGCAEMPGVFRGHDGNILAETVDQHSDHVVFRFQGDVHLLTPVHSEEASCVAGQIELPEFFLSFPVLIRQGDLQHFVGQARRSPRGSNFHHPTSAPRG